jgi:hypothetical protein
MRGNLKKPGQPAVADILPGLVQQNGWEMQLDLHSIFDTWEKVVDSEAANHCRPLKITRGTLWLEADNSAWLQQLRYQKNQLLDAINNSLKKSRIEDIKFVLPKGGNVRKDSDDERVRFVPPPSLEIDNFKTQISFIGDEQCREALFRFWYLVHACRKK